MKYERKQNIIFLNRRKETIKLIETMVQNRISKGISQREIADRLGLSQSAIAYFEKGKNDSATIFIEYLNMGLLYK